MWVLGLRTEIAVLQHVLLYKINHGGNYMDSNAICRVLTYVVINPYQWVEVVSVTSPKNDRIVVDYELF